MSQTLINQYLNQLSSLKKDERLEIPQFNNAVGQFRQDLPAVLEALRSMIEVAYRSNKKLVTESQRFLVHAQEAIRSGSAYLNNQPRYLSGLWAMG